MEKLEQFKKVVKKKKAVLKNNSLKLEESLISLAGCICKLKIGASHIKFSSIVAAI